MRDHSIVIVRHLSAGVSALCSGSKKADCFRAECVRLGLGGDTREIPNSGSDSSELIERELRRYDDCELTISEVNPMGEETGMVRDAYVIFGNSRSLIPFLPRAQAVCARL